MKSSFAYRSIVFLQGEEAAPVLDILEEKGEKATVEHLSQWDYGEGDVSGVTPWGTSDRVKFKAGYYLSYNNRLGYISLTAPATRAQCIQWGIEEKIERERI